MPRLHARAGARILERLVLQPCRLEPEYPTHIEQSGPIRAHQVNHRLATIAPALKPNAAVEGEDHALAAARELLPGPLYVQVILPSTVAGPIGPALP